VAGFIEDLVGFARCKTLVPQTDGQPGQLAQRSGEGLRLFGLGAQVAGEVHGVADHYAYDAKPPGEARQGAQVVAGDAAAFALKREHGLGGEAEFVRHGDADAAVADVEGQIARFGFQMVSQLSWWIPLGERLAVSHPFAKCANGWGTEPNCGMGSTALETNVGVNFGASIEEETVEAGK
jgi:hypothetical protein